MRKRFFFQSSGIDPEFQAFWKMFVNQSMKACPPDFSNSGNMSQPLEALLFLTSLASATSISTGWNASWIIQIGSKGSLDRVQVKRNGRQMAEEGQLPSEHSVVICHYPPLRLMSLLDYTPPLPLRSSYFIYLFICFSNQCYNNVESWLNT